MLKNATKVKNLVGIQFCPVYFWKFDPVFNATQNRILARFELWIDKLVKYTNAFQAHGFVRSNVNRIE